MAEQVTSEKKVLIVAYYWPPSGGSGVQRWLKFVKYLPQFGWKPYVFTPDNPSFAIQDPSLLKDVPAEAQIIRFPIWEPYEAFLKISGLLGNKKSAKPSDLVKTHKQSAFEKISTWIRGNFFIPDPRRFWIKPSVKYLDKFLKENMITTIITTGPPHSMHLIGLNLKKKNPGLRWIADFRDPWSEWGLLDSLNVSKTIRSVHRRLEYKVLSTADIVTTITPFYVRHFERLGGRKVALLTNGFDEDDFKNVTITRDAKFIIRHVGIVNEKCNPRPFMLALQQLITNDPNFAADLRMEFIGEVNGGFKSFVKEHPTLDVVTSFIPSIPHKQLLATYGSSAVLLLVLTGYKDAAGYMPGKLFEYMATGLPILGVGPVEGDASHLLDRSKAGKMVDSDDETGIIAALKHTYSEWKSDSAKTKGQQGNQSYSRKEITKSLTDLLNQ